MGHRQFSWGHRHSLWGQQQNITITILKNHASITRSLSININLISHLLEVPIVYRSLTTAFFSWNGATEPKNSSTIFSKSHTKLIKPFFHFKSFSFPMNQIEYRKQTKMTDTEPMLAKLKTSYSTGLKHLLTSSSTMLHLISSNWKRTQSNSLS